MRYLLVLMQQSTKWLRDINEDKDDNGKIGYAWPHASPGKREK